MRILMVYKTYKGGVAVHVKEVSRELERKGIEVSGITRNEDLGLSSFFSSYFKLRKLFVKWSKKYDIIHTHDWSITYIALRSGIKNVIATFHGFPTNFIAKYFENYCINSLGNRAIVVSPFMKRKYKRSTYIPNGVDLTFFKPLKEVERKKLLVGILQKYNRDKILRVVKKMKLNWISTEGKLPFEKLPEFYSTIGIFISIPPTQAGFNMVWLEAMACEVPYIIGTNVGIGEILPIYKISKFEELENILLKIRDGKLQPLRNQRKWIIKNKLTWKNCVRNLVKVYEEII
ncbi:MAG: glycosyltransferase family 4 protein [Candidatus Aenigmatarchaeota archaeon]